MNKMFLIFLRINLVLIAFFFSIRSFADVHFVTLHQKTIMQNTTSDGLYISYSICKSVIYGYSYPKCSPPLFLYLLPSSSNYQNPIVINLDRLTEIGMINVISITDLKTHVVQRFGSFSSSSCGTYAMYSNSSLSVVTFSQLIDNHNIFVCTVGNTKLTKYT